MNPYWTNARLPTAAELEEGCKAVAQMLLEGRSTVGKKRATEAAQLLFGLSRVGLPDVRANHFWPEVVRELRARSGLDISEESVALLYRGWLEEAYGDSIDRDTHHKYIGLVFEQAGIGSGRDRIIRDFLRSLVDVLGESTPGTDSKEIVRQALHTFQEHARSTQIDVASDISPLRTVLLRVGYAVAEFAEFVRGYPQKWRLATWGWAKVKEVWQDASGVDPDTLTPSAQKVLHEIVSWLARTVTRRDVFRALREGSINVRLPGSNGGVQATDWMDLPIGPARIKGAFGEAVVALADHHALTAVALVNRTRDEWISYEGIHFRVSNNEFTATLPNGRVRASVPLYVGETPERAVRKAFYCGLDVLPSDGIATSAYQVPSLPSRNRLFLDWTFFYDPSGLRLRIRGFKVSDAIEAKSARLTLGSQVVWRGAMDAGVPAGWFPRTLEVLQEHIETGCVVITYEDDNDTVHRVRLAIREREQPAFLAVRGRIVHEYTVTPVDSRMSADINLYVANGLEPRCQGGGLAKSGESTFAGRTFTRYSVHLFVGTNTTTVSARAREWRFVESVSFSAELAIPAECSIGDVTCNVVGPLRIATRDSQLTAVIRPSSQWSAPPDYLRLHIGAPWDLKLPIECSQLRLAEDRWEFDVGRVLEAHGLGCEREVAIGIGAWDSNPEEMFTIAFIDGADVEPCRLEDVSSVALQASDGQVLNVAAREAASHSAVAERKKAAGYLDFGTGRAWFSWFPIVEDVALNGRAGTKLEYRIGAADLDPGPLMIGTFGAPGTRWSICIGESALQTESGVVTDISEAVEKARALSDHALVHITAASESTHVVWELADTIIAEQVSAAWQPPTHGVLKLDVMATVKALSPNRVRLSILGSGRVISDQVVEFSAKEKGIRRQEVKCKLAVPAAAAADGLALEVAHRAVVVRSVHLAAPPALEEGPDIKVTADTVEEIREALKQYRQTGNISFGEHAISQVALYVSASGKLPLREESLLAPVINAKSADAGIRRLMVDCIRVLGAVNGDGTTVTPEYRRSTSPVMTLIMATLVIFQQAKIADRGWMNPETVGQACEQLVELAASGPPAWRDWCAAVFSFGKSLIGVHGEAAAPFSKVSKGKALPLAGLSQNFQHWLLEKQKEHEH